jgi:hypothetical protein
MSDLRIPQDHIPCGDCDEFTHLVSAEAVRRLPRGYCGESCERCAMWMCRLDKLTEPKEDDR